MKLSILGCNGPFPDQGGACSGYLVESDSRKTKLVLDLGSGTLSRLLELTSLNSINALILSHLHFDHMSDVTVLSYMLDFYDIESFKVICPETPQENRRLIRGKLDAFPPQDVQVGEFTVQFTRVNMQ